MAFTTEAMADDPRRDRKAAEQGWVVVRATWDEIVNRPSELIEDLRSVLAQGAG